jgi:hypothetical protein
MDNAFNDYEPLDDFLARKNSPAQSSAQDDSLDAYLAKRTAPTKPADQGGFFSSVRNVAGATLAGAGQAAKDITGYGDTAIQAGRAIQDANRPAVQSFSDIAERPGKWISESAGQMGGQAGLAIAGGLAGRAAGAGLGALTGPLAPVAIPALSTAGAYIGGNLPMLAQEYGSARQEQEQLGVDDKGRALTGALATTAIENLGGLRPGGMANLVTDGVNTLAGKSIKEGAKIVGKQMLRSGVEEGLEEIPQEFTGAYAGGQDDLLTAENLQQGLFGAVSAFPGGALFGAGKALGPLARASQQAPVTPQEAVSEAQNANPNGDAEEIIRKAREAYNAADVNLEGAATDGSPTQVRTGAPTGGADDAGDNQQAPAASKEQALKDQIIHQRQQKEAQSAQSQTVNQTDVTQPGQEQGDRLLPESTIQQGGLDDSSNPIILADESARTADNRLKIPGTSRDSEYGNAELSNLDDNAGANRKADTKAQTNPGTDESDDALQFRDQLDPDTTADGIPKARPPLADNLTQKSDAELEVLRQNTFNVRNSESLKRRAEIVAEQKRRKTLPPQEETQDVRKQERPGNFGTENQSADSANRQRLRAADAVPMERDSSTASGTGEAPAGEQQRELHTPSSPRITDERQDANAETGQEAEQERPLLDFTPTHRLNDGYDTPVRMEDDGSYTDRDGISYTADNEAVALQPQEVEAYREQEKTQAQNQAIEAGAEVPAGGIERRPDTASDGRVSNVSSGLPGGDQGPVAGDVSRSRSGVSELTENDKFLAQQDAGKANEIANQKQAKVNKIYDDIANKVAAENGVVKPANAPKNIPLHSFAPEDLRSKIDAAAESDATYQTAKTEQQKQSDYANSIIAAKRKFEKPNESTQNPIPATTAQPPAQNPNTPAPGAIANPPGTQAEPMGAAVQPVLSKQGKPFSTKKVAQLALESSAYPETKATHEIVKVDGGYGLAPKNKPDIAAEATVTDEPEFRQASSDDNTIHVIKIGAFNEFYGKGIEKAAKALGNKNIGRRGEYNHVAVSTMSGSNPFKELQKKGFNIVHHQSFQDLKNKLNVETSPPKNEAPQETNRAQPGSLADFTNKKLDKSGYRKSYEEEPDLLAGFKNRAKEEWKQQIESATERLPDHVIDEYVDNYGMDSLQSRLRGVHEKAIEGWMPKYIREAVTPKAKPLPINQRNIHERTWPQHLEQEKLSTPRKLTRKEISEAKDRWISGVIKAKYDGKTIPENVLKSFDLANGKGKLESRAPQQSLKRKLIEQRFTADELADLRQKAGEVRDINRYASGRYGADKVKGVDLRDYFAQPLVPTPAKTPEVEANQKDAVAKKPTTVSNNAELSQEPVQKSPESIHVADDVSKKGESLDASENKKPSSVVAEEATSDEGRVAPIIAESTKGQSDKNGTFINNNIDLFANQQIEINRKYFKNNIAYELNNTNKAMFTNGEHFYIDGEKAKVRPDGSREQYGAKIDRFDTLLKQGMDNGTISYNAKAKKRYDELVAEREKYRVQQENEAKRQQAIQKSEHEKTTQLDNILSKTKFKKGSFVSGFENGSKELTDGYIVGELIAHKLYKKYAVSHVKTGIMVLQNFSSLADAKKAAARLDRSADLSQLTKPEDAKKDALKPFVTIAKAIKGNNLNPLASVDVSELEQPKLSQSQSTTGSTVAELTAELDAADKKLLQSGRLNIVQKTADVPDSAVSIDANGIEGWYDPRAKKIYIVADNVTPETLRSTLNHEYLHAALDQNPKLRDRLLGAQSELRDIFAQVEAGKYTGRHKTLYDAAMRRVDRANTPAADRFEEWQAYSISEWHKSPQSLPERLVKAIANLVASIKAVIYRYTGVPVGRLSPADLSALAKSAMSLDNQGVQNYSQGKGVTMASTKSIPNTIIVDGKERRTDNSNGDLISQTEDGIRNFWRWFGDSAVIDKDGSPLVVYHGSKALVHEFKKVYGGIYFAEDSQISERYANDAKPHEYYLKSPNEFDVNADYAESVLDEIEESVFGEDADEMLIGPDGRESLYELAKWGNLIFGGREAQDKTFDALMKRGYTGVKIPDFHGGGENEIIHVVFEPNQIKSATANDGTFSPQSPDIRYSLADDVRDRVDRLFGNQAQDNSDPNAELNRRIREQHKTISDRAKQWLKREFAPGGLLPKQVFDLKIDRDSQMNAEELIAHNLVANLDRTVKAAFGKKFDELEPAQKDLIDARLKGESVNLPQDVIDSIDAMRLHVDRLSARYAQVLFDEATQLQEAGKDAAAAAKVQLLNTIAGNIGKYVNRSYRAFDDENWPRKVPDEVLNNARQYFVNRFTEKGAENPTGDAQRVMNDILKTGTAYDTFEQYIKESKLGAKDLSMLIKRKEIAPEVRALLGEYKDARINFVKSATKMSRLIFNDDFLKQVKTAGLVTEDNQNGFLFDENNRPSDEHTVKIAADSSSPMAPLNGLYTYPEINQAFTDALNRESMEDWYRFIVQANGLVKYGKTVLSPTTAIRNWMSAYFFTLANGHFDLSHMKESMESFKTYFDRDNGRLGYLTKLKRLGVIYDTPYAGEMMALLADSKFESALMGEGRSKLDKAKVAIKDWMDMATKFYQFGDDFWKIIGFENEKQNLIKYRNMSEADAEVEAAKRIRDTYPTYSMVGRAINKLRRFPLVGTFVSFPAEILRTSFNMLKYAQEDMQHSKELGRKRIAGLSMVSGFAFAAQMLAMSLTGMDDDEEEALRDLAPPWSKNSNIIPLGRDKDGSLIYLDLSFLDPYNYFKRPLNAILRGQPIDETVYEIGRELLTPFLGQDIAFGAITDIWQNKKDSGGRVFNPNDTTANITLDIANHLRKALQPGIVSNMERMSDAITGYKSQSGKVNTVTEELAGLVGFRASRLNPKVALYYKSYEFQDKLKDASAILNDVARNPNKVSQSELQSAYEQARETRSEAFTDMHELVNAAKKAGLTTSQIRTLLKLNNVSEKNINYILMGKEPKWTPGKTFLQSSIKKSGELFGAETTGEFKKRRQFVLSE